jgi:hypothetical protein
MRAGYILHLIQYLEGILEFALTGPMDNLEALPNAAGFVICARGVSALDELFPIMRPVTPKTQC